MTRGTLKRLGILLEIFWKHGQYGLWTLWFFVAPGFYLFTRFFMWLDTIVFPELNYIEVDKPVFIMGHPRSGTTFFQQQIHQSGKVASFTTWEIFFPSLIQRRLFMPLIYLLKVFGIDVLQEKEQGHEIRLAGVEEDEALFLHRLDTEMVTIFCPWLLTDDDYMEVGFQLGWTDEQENRRSLRFYEECLKRQIYHTRKRQIVAKCNPSIFRLNQLINQFPDAQVVYIVRSPQKSVRSFLAFTNRFVSPLLSEEEQDVFFRRKYKWSVQLYHYFEEVKGEIPEDQLLIIPFREIAGESTLALKRFYDFTGISPSAEYWKQYQEDSNGEHDKQHTNEPLEQFGVSSEEVEEDLGFVWKKYLRS